ncbi:MAG: DUF4440 domain-containing protein [Acidobacteria bacterium]|nr:DUF4440 domain-containing protein [Acidobacteriota bacterium]
MKKRVVCAFAAGLALMLIGCQQAPPPAPKPDLKAEAAKIMEADAAWMKAAQEKDAAKIASFYAEDGTSHSAGRPAATGRMAIQKLVEEVSKAQVSLSWKTANVVVAEAGDIAYQTGSWESVEKDAKGKPMQSAGKFLTVWARQADGSWKVKEDMGNAEAPPAPVK